MCRPNRNRSTWVTDVSPQARQMSLLSSGLVIGPVVTVLVIGPVVTVLVIGPVVIVLVIGPVVIVLVIGPVVIVLVIGPVVRDGRRPWGQGWS